MGGPLFNSLPFAHVAFLGHAYRETTLQNVEPAAWWRPKILKEVQPRWQRIADVPESLRTCIFPTAIFNRQRSKDQRIKLTACRRAKALKEANGNQLPTFPSPSVQSAPHHPQQRINPAQTSPHPKADPPKSKHKQILRNCARNPTIQHNIP